MNPDTLLYNVFWISLYIVILIAFISWVLYSAINFKRKRFEKDLQYNLTFFQIKVPAQNEIEIEAAEHLFSGLVGIRRSFWQSLTKGQYKISFEIVSKKDGIGFYVVAPDDIVTFVEKQINGAYPSAEIDIIDPNEVWDRGAFTEVAQLKLAGPPYFPIKTYKDMEKTDPLNLITTALSKLDKDEVIALQYVISPAGGFWRSAGNSFIRRIRNSSNSEKGGSVDTSFVEGVEKKIGKTGFDVAIRVVSIADNKQIAQTHIKNVTSSFEQFTDAKYNKLSVKKTRFSKKLIDNFIYRRLRVIDLHIPLFNIALYRNTIVLNTEEMATAFHFPNQNIQTPNILWLEARRAAAPTNLPSEGLYLGKNVFRNTTKKIYMLSEDRTRHMYIIGQTGTGKSEFMKTLALQDIFNGNGVAFIDPHGSDIDDILTKIPKERIDDVILFDLADTERPLGLNILTAHTEEQKNMVINSFIALLYKLYDPNRQGIMGPQLERAIRNVMLTAMIDPESTMVDVLRLLIDPKYSQSFIPRIKDPLVKKYWTDEMAQTSDFHKSEKLGYIVSKFDRFVTERSMRTIVGQPKSAFDLNDIMANRKILLVDLSKGKIGEENSTFIGLLLVPQILTAALARATLLGKREFPDFYLYVDEFQNFATPDFATILSEARKYKLNLTVAHQFVAQLQDEIKDAIFGNVGTMAAFRVGNDDAEYLESQFEPVFTQSDLINNPVGNAYIRLLINGHPSPPFSFAVDWDMVNATIKSNEVADEIRQKSREKYGRPIEEVEQYINERAGFVKEQPRTQGPLEQRLNAKKALPF